MTAFDASTLARGWLSVSLASSKDGYRPALNRTVLIEAFEEGVRLVATDSFLLLSAWVPNREHWGADAPDLEEAPYAVAVAIDEHGRARGLMGHALALAIDAEKAEVVEPEVRLPLAVVSATDRPSFAGMEPAYVSFEVPDRERLRLRTYDGDFPTWRSLVTRFDPVPTTQVALVPDRLAVLSKLGKYHTGAIGWSWGGELGMARIEVIGSDPRVDGVVMPCHWDIDAGAPRVDAPPPPTEGEVDELLPAAAEAVVAEQLGSITLLRSRLTIGSARAGALLDEMQRRGLVGPALKGRPRPVLVEALDSADLDALTRPMEDPA